MKGPCRIMLVIAASFLITYQAQAQNEPTLYFMNSLPQVVYTSPASVPKYKFSIGFPGSSVFIQYANTAFTYNSFAAKQGDSTVVDMNKLYSALKKKNYITNNIQADLFCLSFKVNARMYFTYSLTVKGYNRIMIPKDLIALVSEGTSQ